MTEREEYQLEVWHGDWGLPSIDIECLQILTYAKMARIPLKVIKHNNPFMTPHGRLPVLRAGNTILETFPEMVEFFKTKNYSLNDTLDPHYTYQKSGSYITMLKRSLHPAVNFIRWIDQQNVDQLIRPWYSKAMPFLVNFYYVGKYEREARDFFQNLYPLDDTSEIETKVYSEAQKLLKSLSECLENRNFIFGDEPSAADAILYSYLSLIHHMPLPNAALQNYLKTCTNLVKYITHISQTYFADDFRDYEKQTAQENTKKMGDEMNSDYPEKRRNQILAGLFAGVAMVGYALSTGIVEVPTSERSISEALEEYEDNEDYK